MLSDRSARRAHLRGLVLVVFVLGAALSRLLPHPPNFTAVGAMALFGGAYFASRISAVVVPLVAMLVADLAILVTQGWPLGWMTLIVYGCIATSSVIGFLLRERVGGARVAATSLVSAVLFFVVTNFAVWAGGLLYTVDADGLLRCYVAALPFFENSLAGYAVYGTVLFGGFELLRRRFDFLDLEPAEA